MSELHKKVDIKEISQKVYRNDYIDGITFILLGFMLLFIAGIINLVLFSIILYSSFALPAFSGPVGPVAIAFIVGIYVVGLIIYFAVAAYRKQKGVDLNLLYSEIPPE